MDHHKHIILKRNDLSDKEYISIKKLEVTCNEKQKTNLKLELDFKGNLRRKVVNDSITNKMMTEFLYYEDDILVGYLGICNFGGASIEISGMVHPEFRMRGIFKKLYLIAKEEWEKSNPQEVLALCDHTSVSGLAFINSNGFEYASSEYKMSLNNKKLDFFHKYVIKLRLATNEDANEIDKQSSVYFGDPIKDVPVDNDDETEVNIQKPLIQEEDNFISYMAEFDGKIIGKIHLSITNNNGFIYGFGVLPDFRGNGFGREILNLAMDILKKKNVENIFLDVECQNKTALELYESCGFEEISVMDYYIVS